MKRGTWGVKLRCGALVASLYLCGLACGGESFSLRSSKTGLVYGPFTLVNDAKLMLGASEFTVVCDPAPVPSVEISNEKAQLAYAAATEWLALVDREGKAEAWQSLAAYAREVVKQEDFLQSLQRIEGSLGKVVARKLKSAKYLTAMPSAPDGHYMVLVFETRFEKKAEATETVIPMQQEDGSWRVSGYDVR